MTPKYRAICNQYGKWPLIGAIAGSISLALKENHLWLDYGFMGGCGAAAASEYIVAPVLAMLRVDPIIGSRIVQGAQAACVVAGVAFGIAGDRLTKHTEPDDLLKLEQRFSLVRRPHFDPVAATRFVVTFGDST